MRFIGYCACALVVAVAAAGCGPSESADGITRLTYWRTLSGPAGDAQDELVARFNATNPAIQVEPAFQGTYSDLATKIMTAAAARSGPDVTQLGTFEIREFARSGALVDLTPYIAMIDTSDWPASLIEAGKVDGGTYWLPFNVAVPVLYYNEEALQQGGIEVPETWSAFIDAARTLTQRDTNGRVTRAGLALWNITWPLVSMIWSEGGELTDRAYTNVTLNDPVAVRVLTQLQNLAKEGCIILPDKASGGHRAAFISGRAAMILDSQDAFGEVFTQTKTFTPGLAQYPAGSAGKVYAPGGGGLALLTSAASDHREAAWSFVSFMLAPDQLAYYAEQSGYLAFTGAAQERMGEKLHDPRFRTMHDALQYVRGDFSINMSPAVRNAFDEAFTKILISHADVQATLDAADAQAEAAIASERAG